MTALLTACLAHLAYQEHPQLWRICCTDQTPLVIQKAARMSGALGAFKRSLTQAPKLARGIKYGQTVKGGHHDVSRILTDVVPGLCYGLGHCTVSATAVLLQTLNPQGN